MTILRRTATTMTAVHVIVRFINGGRTSHQHEWQERIEDDSPGRSRDSRLSRQANGYLGSSCHEIGLSLWGLVGR